MIEQAMIVECLPPNMGPFVLGLGLSFGIGMVVGGFVEKWVEKKYGKVWRSAFR